MKKLLCLGVALFLVISILPAYADWSEEQIKAFQMTQAWKKENGYDFPIYGSTAVDLSPISDYLSLLESKDIYIKLPDLVISHDHDEYEWIYSKIGDQFYITYVYYFDDLKYNLSLELPRTYRPKDEALKLLIVSTLSVDEEEAARLYNRLQYNVIDGECVIETDSYKITFYEPRYRNGELASFVSLYIEKNLEGKH